MAKEKKIAIIDSGYANLYSVQNAISALGYQSDLISNLELSYDCYIFPGVGSFEQVKNNLVQKNLFTDIQELAKSGKPLLGICLGMQLMFESSVESSTGESIEGLGLFQGSVERLPEDKVKSIPHIGWNKLNLENSCPRLTTGIELDKLYMYFVHSYYVTGMNRSELITYTTLGEPAVEIPAIIGRDNIYGMQFHPERSGEYGLKLLKNFISHSETI